MTFTTTGDQGQTLLTREHTMSYDAWKTRAPEDEPGFYDGRDDDREYVACDRCEKQILDGAADNGRIGPFYLCGPCYSECMDVINGRARAARSDELRDDADAMAQRVDQE